MICGRVRLSRLSTVECDRCCSADKTPPQLVGLHLFGVRRDSNVLSLKNNETFWYAIRLNNIVLTSIIWQAECKHLVSKTTHWFDTMWDMPHRQWPCLAMWHVWLCRHDLLIRLPILPATWKFSIGLHEVRTCATVKLCLARTLPT